MDFPGKVNASLSAIAYTMKYVLSYAGQAKLSELRCKPGKHDNEGG